MAKKEPTTSDWLKVILTSQVGGEGEDWKRLSKKRVYGGDVAREFENKATGQKISIYERADGLLYAELPDGSQMTARIPVSGDFNDAAQPPAVDRVMNALLEDKDPDDLPPGLYAQAVKEGLSERFSFCLTRYDGGGGEEDSTGLYTMIYPTVRDATFKCPSWIRPMVPKGDDIDECVVTEWRFDKGIDTPAQIVKYLQSLGMKWDEDSQKREKDFYAEIKSELGAAKAAPAAEAKGPKH
jgi:hypothetical protein